MNRPSVFDDDDLDLAQFTPKADTAAPSNELVRRVADAGGFPSRAAQPFVPQREPLTYRTGRTATFTVKTTPSTIERFYDIARRKGWKVGETFERAVELLVREDG